MSASHRLSTFALMALMSAPSAGVLASGRPALASGGDDGPLRVAASSGSPQSPTNRAVAEAAIRASLSDGDLAGAYAAYDQFVRTIGGDAADLLRPIAAQELRDVIARAVYDPSLRAQALERLARYGDDQARARLRQVSTDAARPEALLAERALSRLGERTRGVDPADLAPGLPSRSRMAAAEAVGQTGLQGEASLLVPLLRDGNPATRMAALDALGSLRSPDVTSDVRSLLADEHPTVRSRAMLTLARLGDTDAMAGVSAMLRSPVAEARLEALEADPTVPLEQRSAIIKAILSDADPLTRAKAAEALTRLEPEAARPTLVALTTDPDSSPRREAARVLETLDPVDVALFRRLLADGSDWVRMYAAGGVLRAARQ
jgi:HEAT repeat protein